TATTSSLPGLALLAGHASLDEPLAWRAGRPFTRRQYLHEVQQLAEALPAGGPVLAMTADRYHFALALGAVAARGESSLMPPNHTPDMVRRLRELFPRAYVLGDTGQPALALPTHAFPAFGAPPGEP